MGMGREEPRCITIKGGDAGALRVFVPGDHSRGSVYVYVQRYNITSFFVPFTDLNIFI